jgi:hypothetical protein
MIGNTWLGNGGGTELKDQYFGDVDDYREKKRKHSTFLLAAWGVHAD